MSEFDLNKVTLLGTDEEEEPIASPIAQTVEGEAIDDGFDLGRVTPPNGPSEDFKIDQALQQSPDTHKRNKEISESTGVPQDIVERDNGELERATKVNEIRSVLKESPVLNNYAMTGNNSQTIHDDIKELSEVEKIFKQMPDLYMFYELGKEGYQGVKKSAIGTLASMHVSKGEDLVTQGQDVGRSFWEIMKDEVNRGSFKIPGTDIGIPSAFDAFNAVKRYEMSRVYGDATEAAKGEFKEAKRLSDVAASMEMSETSKRSYDAIDAATKVEGDWADKADAVMVAMASDPVGLLNLSYEVFMESSIPLIAGAGVTALTQNPAAGASTMLSLSGARERFSVENLAKTGTDLSKEEDINALVSDPEKMQEARKFGQERMVPILALDAASMGLAGKVLSKMPGANAFLQSVFGGVLGGLGELFAQKGSEGEVTDWTGVVLEVIVEVASAPMEILTANTGDTGTQKIGNFNVNFNERTKDVQGKIDRGKENEKLLKDVSKAISKTKTNERDPEAMKDITTEMAEKYGTDTVYLKAESVEKLLQSVEEGDDIFENETVKKIIEQAPGAIERGEMIEVPIGEYFVDIGSKENLGDKFNQHASFKNNGLTPAEMSDDAIQEEIAKATEEDRAAIQKQNEEEIVFQDLVQSYVDIGIDQSVAEAKAQMHVAIFKTVASRDDGVMEAEESEGSDVDRLISKAREGDESAQAQLEEYGLKWEHEPVVRFVSKEEVDSLTSGERFEGKNNGRVDVTKDTEGKNVPATDTSYRVSFKESFDDKVSSGRVKMKSDQDGWVEGGYDLNDVALIEEKQEDGSWKVVHEGDAQTSLKRRKKTIVDLHKEWKGTSHMELDSDVKEALKKIDNFDVLLDNIREENYPSVSDIHGMSASEFIISEGGISEKYSTEAIDADIDPRGKKKRKNYRIFREGGVELDVMGKKLEAEGYLAEEDNNAVLDLIQRSIAGDEQYIGEADPVKQEMLNNMEYVEDILFKAGIDIKTASNDEIRQAITTTNEQDVEWLRQMIEVRRNSIGLYSAVEKAMLEMRIPAWKATKDRFTVTLSGSPESRFDSEAEALEYISKKDNPELFKVSPPEKISTGLVSGTEIWAKFKKGVPGVKQEELEWLGLEEFLTLGKPVDSKWYWLQFNNPTGSEAIMSKDELKAAKKFTRQDVVNFIQNKGVQVVEVVGDQEKGDEFQEIRWNEAEVWDDDEAWSWRVDDMLYQFDQGGSEFDRDSWLEDNIKKVIANYSLSQEHKDEIYALGDEYGGSEYTSKVLDYLRSINYDPTEDMAYEMRNDAEEEFRKQAQDEYNDNPIWIKRSEEFDDGTELIIFGNDDEGYDIRTSMRHADIVVHGGELDSMTEAEIQADNYARENELFEEIAEEERVARWDTHVMDGPSENYRELKLILPEIEGDFYEEAHFPDRNIVTFLRVDDRDLLIGEPTTPEKPSDDDWAVRKMQGEEGSDETFGELRTYIAELEGKLSDAQKRVDDANTRLRDGDISQEVHEAQFDDAYQDVSLFKKEMTMTSQRLRIAEAGFQSRRDSEVEKETYFIDEFQSDWHQQGRQKGYQTGEDVSKLDEEAVDLLNSMAAVSDNEGIVQHVKQAIATHRPNKAEILDVASEVFSEGEYAILEKNLDDNLGRLTELSDQIRAERYGVPDAPFKGDGWMSLGLKRAVVDAVENGYEAIAWPNVEVLVDRYHEKYRQLYTKQYQEKMPSIIKKITGQKPVHMDLDGNVIGGLDKDGVPAGYSIEEIKEENVNGDPVVSWRYHGPNATGAKVNSYEEAVKQAIGNYGSYPKPQGYYIVELTDEFKKKVMEEGLTLFQKDKFTRGYYIPSQKRTVYTAKHNLSTYLHEPGHKFLELMRSMSHRSKSIADDLIKFEAWTVENNVSDQKKHGWQKKFEVHKARIIKQGKVPSEHIDLVAMEAATNEVKHEMFASGFETYLMEGKAPTVELESLFARFKAWLIHTYEWLKSNPFKANNLSDVKMTDEIRGVFDRLFATDEAIERSKYEQGHQALPVEDMGLNPKLIEEYQLKYKESKDQAKSALMAKVMGELASQQKKEFKQSVAHHLEAIKAQYAEKTRYQVRDGIVSGNIPKLDYEQVKSLVDKEKAQYLSKAGLTKKGGADPDAIVFLPFGYSSGSRMLTDLYNTKGKADLRKEQKLLAINKAEKERGDIYQTGGLDEAAEEIVHSEKQGRLHAMELQMLNKMLPGGFVTQSTAGELNRKYKASAEQTVNNTPIHKLNPRFHKSNQQKHNNDVVRFSTQGKFAEAREAKHKALRQFHLYSESMKAKQQADKHAKYARSFKGNKWKKIQKAGDYYIEQMNGILQKFEFKAISGKAIARRQNMADWINKIFSEAGEGNPTSHHDTLTKDQKSIAKQEEQEDTQKIMSDHGITDAMMAEAETVNYKTLTPVELQAVVDSIKTVESMSNLENKLFTLVDKISLKEAINQLVSEIKRESTSNKKKSLGSTKEGKQERKERLKSFIDMSKSPTGFIKMLGGYKQGSLAWKLLGQPLRDSASMETDQINKANKDLEEIFKRGYSKKELGELNRKIYDKHLDVDLTKHDVISFLLNWGNVEGRNRVMDGHGLSEEDVMYLFDKYLDEKDHNFAKDMWKYVGTFKKAAFDLHRDMFGFTPEEVLPLPFDTKYGVMPGGYYTISYDKAKSARAEQHAMTKTTDSFRKSIASKTEMGSNKSRVKRVFRPLETDIMKVAYSHISEVIHKTTHTRALYDVGRLLANDKVKGAITDAYGEHVYRYITDSVRDIHDGSEGVKDIHDRFALFIRNNATLSMLALSIRTITLQPFGVTNSIVKARLLGVGSKNLFKAYTKYSLSPIAESRIAREESVYMRNRENVMSTAVSRIKNALRNIGTFGKVKESGMIPIMKAQFYTVDMPLYIAVRDHFIPLLGREGAIKEAEQAVIDAQGGGNIMDTPRAMMGGPYRKMWNNFLSYMMATYTLQSENYDKTFRKHDQNIFDFSVNTFVALMVPAVLMTMLNAVQNWDPDDEDLLDVVKDEFSENLWREQISFLMGTNTYTAQFSGALMGYDYQGPQGTAIISKIIKLAEQSSQGDMDEAWARAAITAFGLATGLSSSQTNRVVFGAKQAIEGGESPLSVVKKVMFGKTYNN